MENKESKSYIERIEIKGLWGRFDVNWKLHPDVNILVGENGTGKSTILRLINDVLLQNIDIYPIKMESIKAIQILSRSLTNTFEILLIMPQNNYLYYPHTIVVNDHDYNEVKHFTSKQNITLKYFKNLFWDDDLPKIEWHDDKFEVHVKLLETFESKLLETDTISKITQKDVKSSLDLDLYTLETEYWKYQIELFERIVNQGFSKEEVNKNHNLFLQKINHLFKATGKVFGQNSKDKTIIFKQNGLELSLYQLSSGEKQMLIILLTVLLQDQKPTILLLDEPEISMHLTWQYELIEIIRTLNPNCQIIIVTHSPSIFTDGWNDRVFWIEDICKPTQKLEKV